MEIRRRRNRFRTIRGLASIAASMQGSRLRDTRSEIQLNVVGKKMPVSYCDT